MADKKAEALRIVEEGLKELESAKGSIAVAVQKLSRAARLLNEGEIYVWAEIQLANTEYIKPIEEFFNALNKEMQKPEEEQNYYRLNKLQDNLEKFAINYNIHVRPAFDFKFETGSGGLNSVDFIEENYNYIIKNKSGNDGVLYQKNLKWHLDYIKRTAHKYLSELHDKLKFSGTITSSFDLLKNAVDDRLLDLDPEIAEQLMLAFKAVSSDNKEEWSHALTTCRRLLESLADKLYPANDLVINKRTFKQGQFVNRLWQFMNDSIESDSNRDLAQMHVNYLGSWLEKANKITNKGVHDEVSQLEATKAIFHIYLMLADLLDYLDSSAVTKTTKPKITEVSLDEIEALLNVKRDVAKAIVVARVNNKGLTIEQLGEVKGVGPKTVTAAKEVFEF
ncbi:helix-hairpin-helix domain-containing protein [Acinetobacter bereziniae]|uniref:helix-hairpin-helix domain-containing protein n=1 Tax=Acinetobacter bereziniae TaxID=106648 RepID=UPI0035714682